MGTSGVGEARVAAVTGAAAGIGRAAAARIAADGFRIVALDVDLDGAEALCTELAEGGADALATAIDLRDVASIRSAVADAERRVGSIDVLVNSAGINASTEALDVEEPEWDAVLGTNLKGTFFVTQACARGMLDRGWGRVINIASVLGLRGFRRRAAYGSSKGGLINLTRVLAVEWAERGVTVNAIAPGVTETPMVVSYMRDPSYLEGLLATTPDRRVGQPDDVAAAVAFFASDAAQHTTGQILAVDGGFSAQ